MPASRRRFSAGEDPASYAVKRPAWELHKKGEIMSSSDWWGKYYFMSEKPLRASYNTCLIGRIKAYEKVRKIREKEPEEHRPERSSDAYSDTSSHQSMFKGSSVKNLRKRLDREKPGTAPASLRESPDVMAICERIGKLIETDTVQKSCKFVPLRGTKYDLYGGGCVGTNTFRRHSKEDPWEFPKPRWGGTT